MARNHAFTLAELVIALSITAVIGLTTAGVAFTLSHAQGKTEAMTAFVQSARNGTSNIDAAVRKALAVTAMSDSAISLWSADTNDDGGPELDELVLISYEPSDHTVVRQQVVFTGFGSSTVKGLYNDIGAGAYDIDKIRNLMANRLVARYVATTILATDVDSLIMAPDVSAPQTKVVNIRLAVGGSEGIALTDSAALRCPQ